MIFSETMALDETASTCSLALTSSQQPNVRSLWQAGGEPRVVFDIPPKAECSPAWDSYGNL